MKRRSSVLKTDEGESPPRVRIPVPPPHNLANIFKNIYLVSIDTNGPPIGPTIGFAKCSELMGGCSCPLISVVWLRNFNLYPDCIMFRASTLRMIGWVLLTPIVLATAYMLLEIWLFDLNPCSPFICTEGYPCFDQGNCSYWKDPPD